MEFHARSAPPFVPTRNLVAPAHEYLAPHFVHDDPDELSDDFDPALEAFQRDMVSFGINDHRPLKSEWSQFELSATAAAFEIKNYDMPPPNRAVSQQRSAWGLSLPGTVIERNDFVEAANFILECKGQDEAAAINFLRGVLGALTGQNAAMDPSQPWDGHLRGGPPYLTPEDQAAAQAHLVLNQQQSLLLQAQRSGIPPRAPPVFPITVVGDEIDQRLSTLVILVPGRAHIVGHLIGKGGAEVGRIEREMSVTIKIESASKMNATLMERSVCIIGSVASATLAQQFVSHKVHEKLLSEGIQAEVLKMIVPNEIVRHLIGKSGTNINRLQNESGARIQVEPESTMTPGAIGRTIVLQGAERCRTFAQYLILRQIAEDRNVHAEWAGRSPNMTTAGFAAGMAGHIAAIGSAPVVVPSNPQFMASIAGLANGAGMPPPQQQPRSHRDDLSQICSVHMMLADNAVTHLVGINGAAVQEIQSQSGCKMIISKTEAGTRRVTVTGSFEAVEIAQMMIHQRMASYRGTNGATTGQALGDDHTGAPAEQASG